MAQTNYEEFQEMVEQFEPELSLKAICEQEGGCRRSYISWRTTNLILLSISKQSMKYSLLNSSATSQYFSRCCPIQ